MGLKFDSALFDPALFDPGAANNEDTMTEIIINELFSTKTLTANDANVTLNSVGIPTGARGVILQPSVNVVVNSAPANATNGLQVAANEKLIIRPAGRNNVLSTLDIHFIGSGNATATFFN